mgnify:FL=1
MDFKYLIMPIILIGSVTIMLCGLEKEKIMDKFFREKCSFPEAVEALKEGKLIHREGERRKYGSREIYFKGEKQTEYGSLYGDGAFGASSIFYMDDILADDWIIEESK